LPITESVTQSINAVILLRTDACYSRARCCSSWPWRVSRTRKV